jgi:hypothetical protein
MGNSATKDNMLAFLTALETLLARQGGAPDTGVAVAAANRVYASAGAQTANKQSAVVYNSGS